MTGVTKNGPDYVMTNAGWWGNGGTFGGIKLLGFTTGASDCPDFRGLLWQYKTLEVYCTYGENSSQMSHQTKSPQRFIDPRGILIFIVYFGVPYEIQYME